MGVSALASTGMVTVTGLHFGRGPHAHAHAGLAHCIKAFCWWRAQEATPDCAPQVRTSRIKALVMQGGIMPAHVLPTAVMHATCQAGTAVSDQQLL